MARGIVCGAFKRRGSSIIGQIGPVTARWNRHRGGCLALASGRGSRLSAPVEIATRVRVMRDNHPWEIRQENDRDPRLIFCEEGPERIVLRVMYALYDDRGGYHGDGLSETVLWANGDVHVAAAIRLVDLTAHTAVTDAWVEARMGKPVATVDVGTRSAARLQPARMQKPRWFRFKTGVSRRRVVARSKTRCVAFGWYDDACACDARLDGVGTWAGVGREPPFYDRWGHLYSQWGGEAGWAVDPSARLGVVPEGDEVALRWHWLRDADLPAEADMPFRGLLALRFCDKATSAGDQLDAFQQPVAPRVQGAQFRCLDVLENALVFRKTDDTARLTFPRDSLGRTVHVRMYGLAGTGAVSVSAPGGPVTPHLVSHGGLTDDPNGPNMARPGDRYAPVIGDPAVPPDEVVFSVPLSRRGKTIVSVRDVPGIGMAYLKWDDRRLFVIRSAACPVPMATFSFRTLCLHDLRLRPSAQPGLLRLPLYWFQCNASTPFHTLNQLESVRLTENGPDALRLEVVACNRGGRARGTMRAVIPAGLPYPRVHVRARLDVRRSWDTPEIQYLNSFPEDSWQPADWPCNWVLLMDGAGNTMERHFKEPLAEGTVGDAITRWKDRTVLVQGAADRGNVFILARNVAPDGQPHAYRLCRVWLDSHFSVAGLKPPVRAGNTYETEYVLAVWGDKRLSRAQAAEIAAASIEAGDLVLPGP